VCRDKRLQRAGMVLLLEMAPLRKATQQQQQHAHELQARRPGIVINIIVIIYTITIIIRHAHKIRCPKRLSGAAIKFHGCLLR
jgi:hypothetical protein